VCLISKESTSESYQTVCVPGTLEILLAIIGIFSSEVTSPNSQLFLEVFSIIPSAKVIAVPLGASNFLV